MDPVAGGSLEDGGWHDSAIRGTGVLLGERGGGSILQLLQLLRRRLWGFRAGREVWTSRRGLGGKQ